MLLRRRLDRRPDASVSIEFRNAPGNAPWRGFPTQSKSALRISSIATTCFRFWLLQSCRRHFLSSFSVFSPESFFWTCCDLRLQSEPAEFFRYLLDGYLAAHY